MEPLTGPTENILVSITVLFRMPRIQGQGVKLACLLTQWNILWPNQRRTLRILVTPGDVLVREKSKTHNAMWILTATI